MGTWTSRPASSVSNRKTTIHHCQAGTEHQPHPNWLCAPLTVLRSDISLWNAKLEHTYIRNTNQTVTFQLYSFWSAFVLALQNHWDLWAVGGCSVKLSLHHMCNQKTAVSLTKGGHFKGYLFYKGQNACGTETCISMDKWRTSDF